MFGSWSRNGSLYRGLALPFTVFVLLASLVLAGYISYWSQREALSQLQEMAATNAKFTEELQLPRSRTLAEKLSTVLGVRVGFYQTDGSNRFLESSSWPERLQLVLKEATAKGERAFHHDGHDVAIAPFDGEQVYLVLVRDSRSVIATGLGEAVLIPTLILTVACGFLAYYLVRRIVLPLSALTGWLPHLERDDRAAPAMPPEVSGRGDEIGELARSLEGTHRRLLQEQARRRDSERMATLGRIATSLAHEIRNPASSIGLHADLLARNAGPKDSESISLIRAEVDRISDLVNQWLFVVRPAPPQIGRHDLAALVDGMAKSLRTAVEHAGAKLRLGEPATSLPVRCDHARMQQVIRNLLVNAIQAMPEGGEIRISFESDDSYAICWIHDAGPGFSADALERFGEPFFSEREGGMGIGLTLAREVIAAHGGRLEAVNAPGGGAVVRIRLPLADDRERNDL